jgi:hypothetical protein
MDEEVMRSIEPLEHERGVHRLRRLPENVPWMSPSEIWPGVQLLAGVVADGIVGTAINPSADMAGNEVHFVVRAKIAGQLPTEGISDAAAEAAEKIKNEAERQVEAAVLQTTEFAAAAEIGKQLDAARIAHDEAKAKLATAKAERDAVTEANTDASPAIRTPEQYAEVVAAVEVQYLAADERVRVLEKKVAIFAAYLAATKARYSVAHDLVRDLRRKHEMFASAAPLAACRQRRAALAANIERFLKDSARELFELNMIENHFAPGSK